MCWRGESPGARAFAGHRDAWQPCCGLGLKVGRTGTVSHLTSAIKELIQLKWLPQWAVKRRQHIQSTYLRHVEGVFAFCWTEVWPGSQVPMLCLCRAKLGSSTCDSKPLLPGSMGMLRNWLCRFMHFVAIPVWSQDAFAEPLWSSVVHSQVYLGIWAAMICRFAFYILEKMVWICLSQASHAYLELWL